MEKLWRRYSLNPSGNKCIAQLVGGPHWREPSVGKLIALEEHLGLDQAYILKAFGKRINHVKSELTACLHKIQSQGKTIAGFGAPAKATTLMYHFGIGPDVINFIVDDSPFKQGLYSPGMHIPVLPSDAIYSKKPDVVVVLAWNFAKPIINNHTRYLEQGGTFIVPLPEVEIIRS